MSAIAGYGALKSKYEGTVASRNPITGVGHVAFDEPGFDVEGMCGPGTRGTGHKNNKSRELQIQASHKDLEQRWKDNPPPAAEAQQPSRSGGDGTEQTVSTIIKPKKVEQNHSRVQDSPGALTPLVDRTDLEHSMYKSQSFLRFNPITGEGHTSRDDMDTDLDGRKGAGTRGMTGNRVFNHQNASHLGRAQRNVITGEGLKAVHCKDLSDHIVIDGEDESQYGYFHDFRRKFQPANLKPTEMLRWDEANYNVDK